MLERTRFERETAALAADERELEIPVSPGEFGKALARFAAIADVPDAVPWLLQRSATYASMVKTLDQKYVVFDDRFPTHWFDDWAADPDGVLTKGPFQGRRVLEIRSSVDGSFFFPVGELGKLFSHDTMFIGAPPSKRPNHDHPATLTEKGEWIERIAHETTHAHRLVLGLRRAGKTPLERINAGIEDEIETRKSEAKVVAELRSQFPNFTPFQPTTGRTERWAVERDLISASLRRTYLEHFVLNERMRAARAQISAADAEKYDKFVDRIDLAKRPLASYLTAQPRFVNPRSKDRDVVSMFVQAYPNLLLSVRVLDARWRSAKEIGGLEFYRDAGLEATRNAHAAAYFDGIISYTQVP
jgi:hypothetical protein